MKGSIFHVFVLLLSLDIYSLVKKIHSISFFFSFWYLMKFLKETDGWMLQGREQSVLAEVSQGSCGSCPGEAVDRAQMKAVNTSLVLRNTRSD